MAMSTIFQITCIPLQPTQVPISTSSSISKSRDCSKEIQVKMLQKHGKHSLLMQLLEPTTCNVCVTYFWLDKAMLEKPRDVRSITTCSSHSRSSSAQRSSSNS